MQHPTHTGPTPLHDAADIPNGIFTIHNPATNDHRTFKLRTSPLTKGNSKGQEVPNDYFPGQRILSVLIGPDNSGWSDDPRDPNWRDVGNVLPNGKLRIFYSVRNQEWEKLANFAWRVFNLNAQSALPPFVKLLCQNHCLRCNRPLTVPSSILRNYGPDCAEIMGYGPPPARGRKKKEKANDQTQGPEQPAATAC